MGAPRCPTLADAEAQQTAYWTLERQEWGALRTITAVTRRASAVADMLPALRL